MNKNYIFLLFLFVAVAMYAQQPPSVLSAKSRMMHTESINNFALAEIRQKAQKHILVCAHRSFHQDAPENSLSSVRKAIDAGIDLIEIDVRTTKDGVLVLMHDKDIDRLTNGKGNIKDYTFEELQQFNLKIKDSLTSEKIPKLEEVLKLVQGTNVIPNLDLKAVNYRQLYTLLKEHQMEHRVISFIGKKEHLLEMLNIDSFYAVMPLSNSMEDIDFFSHNDHSPLQHFTEQTFNEKMIRTAKESHQLIFVNTLWDQDNEFVKGDNKRMDKVVELRPAIIQTDYPQMLVEYLREKGLHE